ncbi:hypothetical protein [Kitasatospora sp. NBC_01266]|uniref:hypothetical protein n=1 Tax=Kitasatospora sp. NBC_01266 TaxID=2903572 RepID=UPI002E344268|nr:hypothetical protein [Kitasatospora sp. NBC_01266]
MSEEPDEQQQDGSAEGSADPGTDAAEIAEATEATEATEPDAPRHGPDTPDPLPRRAGPPPGRRTRRRHGRRAAVPRFGLVPALLALGLLIGLAGGLWSVPTVRTQLLDSFTNRGTSFTELFFTADPTYEGATVVVPITLIAHGTGERSYQLKLTLESPDGSDAATDTVSLVPKDGAPVPVVVRLQSNGNAAMVRVALVGHPQTLHFRFGK